MFGVGGLGEVVLRSRDIRGKRIITVSTGSVKRSVKAKRNWVHYDGRM